jgi:stage II sporulation protein D
LIPKAFGKIAWVQPANANSSQRIEKIALGDAQGKKIEVTTNQLREAVGNTRIRSTAFQMRQAGSQIQFYGSGFGHGVGMCQIGAREMARQGQTYRDILRYYYPLANLESL